MSVNLDTIEPLLALAMQESEGPFRVTLKLSEIALFGILSKAELLTLTKQANVTNIKLATRVRNRRKVDRGNFDRRLDKI